MMGHAAILLPNDAGHAAPQWPKIVDGVPNIDIVGTSFYGSTTNVTYDSVQWRILTAVSGIFCPPLCCDTSPSHLPKRMPRSSRDMSRVLYFGF